MSGDLIAVLWKRNVLMGSLLIFFLSSCATIESLDFHRRKASFKPLPFPFEYQDYVGIFHVHSRYSHDSKGRFDEIVNATRRAGADFVIVTDHNTLQGLREKMNGFYGRTLILIGDEVSTREGHLAVLGLDKEMDSSLDSKTLLKKIHKLGGLAFIAHGESKHKPWRNWALSPLTGMEVYNLASDVYEDGKFWVTLKVLVLFPRPFFRSVLDQPTQFLRRWDNLLMQRKMVGVGAVDAHQKVRILGRAIDGYGNMFKVVQTHVWAESLTEESILKSLQQGHVYVGFDIVAPVRNFLFLAESSKEKGMMGDELSYQQGTLLKVILPLPGRIHLLKNGQLLETKSGDSLEFQAPSPGVYRVEVYRGKKLWILSNPIYLK